MYNREANNYKDLKVYKFCDLSAEPLLSCEKRRHGIFKEKKTHVIRKWDKKRTIKCLCAILPIFIFVILITGTCVSIYESKLLCLNDINNNNEALVLCEKDEDELDKELILINEKVKLKKDYHFNIVNYNGIKCEKMIVPHLEQMINDAKKEGYKIKLTKGFVDNLTQDAIYEAEVNKIVNSGCTLIRAEAIAKKTISPANSCEYATGLIIEISPDSIDDNELKCNRWIESHCADYGFIQRFPRGKEDKTGKNFDKFVYRYVGQKHAKKCRL